MIGLQSPSSATLQNKLSWNNRLSLRPLKNNQNSRTNTLSSSRRSPYELVERRNFIAGAFIALLPSAPRRILCADVDSHYRLRLSLFGSHTYTHTWIAGNIEASTDFQIDFYYVYIQGEDAGKCVLTFAGVNLPTFVLPFSHVLVTSTSRIDVSNLSHKQVRWR